MATFRTPTDDFVYWAESYETGILARLKPGPRGRNVFKLTDGSFTESQPMDNSLIAHIYHGGHIHPLTAAEETDLRTAGYGDYIEA